MVEDIHFAAVESQVGQVENAGGFLDGQPYAVRRVAAATGGGDSDRETIFGDVVDDSADPPDPTVGGFKL
ncbi:hypothetical protein [Mycobacterium sp. ITM-2016-00318]|uniref:hypothetical protein n=1 Tax=Mycobacterium sp. ITM-2016-00318 TaxID=2099693 RepID=UPI00115BB66F